MKANIKNIKTVLISRTDAIGDVVLTLPLLGVIKEQNPQVKIIFLARSYTKSIIDSCKNIDQFLNWDELKVLPLNKQVEKIKALNIGMAIHVYPVKEIAQVLKKAKIPLRVGTQSRIYHFLTCNIRPRLSRKNSNDHEALLNIKLCVKAGVLNGENLSKDSLQSHYNLKVAPFWPNKQLPELEKDNRKKIILHPGSNLSAKNWPLNRFAELAKELIIRNDLVFLTGTAAEGAQFRHAFSGLMGENLYDLTGMLSLAELMGFIKSCDSLVAASTGPLHIAASLGINAVGLYPPVRPMHPGRWGPIGARAQVVVYPKSDCSECVGAGACPCMSKITADEVLRKI